MFSLFQNSLLVYDGGWRFLFSVLWWSNLGSSFWEALTWCSPSLWQGSQLCRLGLDYSFFSWYKAVGILIIILLTVVKFSVDWSLDGAMLLVRHMVPRNRMLPSVLGDSMVNFCVNQLNLDGWRRCPLGSSSLHCWPDIIHIPLPPWTRYGAFQT